MNKPVIELLHDYAQSAAPEQVVLVDRFVQLLTKKPACFWQTTGWAYHRVCVGYQS